MGSLVTQQHTLFGILHFSITNRGLRLEVPLGWDDNHGYFILPVNHSPAEKAHREYSQGVCLRQAGPDLFVRACPDQLKPVESLGEVKSFQVVKTLSKRHAARIDQSVLPVDIPEEIRSFEVEPKRCWNPSQRTLFAGHTGAFLGYLHFSPPWADEFDFFVLVCRCEQQHYAWTFDFVRGDA